jgi:glycosyltransferase involved in cell wall biosynthesis
MEAAETRLRTTARALVRRAEAFCYHPDLAMPWIRPAVAAGIGAYAREPYSVVWTTAGPVSGFVVGGRIAEHLHLPYVLDFRDAWTISHNDFEALRPKWARLADRRRMYELLQGARAAVFLYESMAECYWQAYSGALDPARIHIISNGYEGEIASYDPPSDVGRCTILYSGTLTDYRYDTLLQAVCLLKQADPLAAGNLHLMFVGEGTEALLEPSERLGVMDMLEVRGPCSRAETARLQRAAHAVLVLGRPRTMKGYELFAGAKLFDYLKAGRPIVGVLPLDETRRILQRIGVTTIADADSPSQIADLLRLVLNAWSQRTVQHLLPDRAACEFYGAEQQTLALIRALDGLPSAEPFVPGRAHMPASLRWEVADGSWLTQTT